MRPATAAFINGRSYLALGDWAGANGFRLVRTSASDEFLVTNRTQRLVFEKNSRRVAINGVNVALSFPVAVDKGAALVAQLDLAKTIAPLIYPPKLAAKKIATICLDPGHGGKDPGNRVGTNQEKVYTLLLAAETLPHDGADAWHLDLFRIALRIARSTETVVDLQRADLAFKALPDRLRGPLALHAAAIARREAELAAATGDPPPRGSGLLGVLISGRRTGPPSGSTAKDRLLREVSRRRLPDPS